MGFELVKKNFKSYKKILDLLVAKLTNYLHTRNCNSKGKKTPSDITLAQIFDFLKGIGIKEGDVIFIHSSWEDLNSGSFSASELIDALVHYIGDQGTLAMPAIPNISQVEGATFKVKRTPSAAGLLTEVFRRYPGVKRSINLNHSVCALGYHAEYLTKDHHYSETSWDKNSPYYRLREYDNAWIIGLGVGHRLKVATSLHCVESALWKENRYFRKLFSRKICYRYIDMEGNEGEHCYWQRTGQIYTPSISKYFSKSELVEETVAGLDVYAIKAKTLIDRSVELGKDGKTMYVWPIPFARYFVR